MNIKNYIKENPLLIIGWIIILILIVNINNLSNKVDIKQKQLIAQDNIIKEITETPKEISKIDTLLKQIQSADWLAIDIQDYISKTKEEIRLSEIDYAEAINKRDCLWGQIDRLIKWEEIDLEYCNN